MLALGEVLSSDELAQVLFLMTETEAGMEHGQRDYLGPESLAVELLSV